MVEIKVDTDEILFRIVFAGRDRATKFATLRVLQEKLGDGGRPMIVMHAGGDRIVGFDLPMSEAERLFGMRVRIEVLARPGSRKSIANDILLHRSADAIIWLDDRGADEGLEAIDALDSLLRELETLGRKPGELPVFIQCYADSGQKRIQVYKTRKRSWKPKIHEVGEDAADEVEVFHAARAAVFQAYRGYEKELVKAGLPDHVKIRDRVYERLNTAPKIENLTSAREIRLVRSQAPRLRKNDSLITFLLFSALVLAIAAAFWIAIRL